ncbi:hypothetical protein QTN25_002915 [Entamoeba marina]
MFYIKKQARKKLVSRPIALPLLHISCGVQKVNSSIDFQAITSDYSLIERNTNPILHDHDFLSSQRKDLVVSVNSIPIWDR